MAKKSNNVLNPDAETVSDAAERFAQEFGKAIFAERRERGVSREQLAIRAELHPQGLRNIESGESSPKLTTAFLLANALGVPLSQLIERVEAKTQGSATSNQKTIRVKYGSNDLDILLQLREVLTAAIALRKNEASTQQVVAEILQRKSPDASSGSSSALAKLGIAFDKEGPKRKSKESRD